MYILKVYLFMLSLSIIRGVPSFNSENVVTAKTTGAVLINAASGARCNRWCGAASRVSHRQKLVMCWTLLNTCEHSSLIFCNNIILLQIVYIFCTQTACSSSEIQHFTWRVWLSLSHGEVKGTVIMWLPPSINGSTEIVHLCSLSA